MGLLSVIRAGHRHAGMFVLWARQTLKLSGVYVIRSPELEDPVPDGVVVKRIRGRHSVRDIELLPVGDFVWRTLHPGHFQTCNGTRFT